MTIRRLQALAAAVVLTITLVATSRPAAADQDGSPVTKAVAVNTHDGTKVFRMAFAVRRIDGSVVSPTNIAVAYSSCTGCQTVAIAFQIVFVEGSPSTFTPQNVAIAINNLCELCDTLASAYQFVIQTPSGHARLTESGREGLRSIRQQLKALRQSGLTGPEMQARIDGLADQVKTIVTTQVEAVVGDVQDSPDLNEVTGRSDAADPPSASTDERAPTAEHHETVDTPSTVARVDGATSSTN